MKIVTNKINNTDEYSIIRYSISELVFKTIILIISYLIYVSLGIFRFKESLSLEIVIKFIIGSLPFFIFLYSEVILAPSKELLLIKENNLILKKYILFFCYYSKILKIENIRKIYYEKVTYKDYPVLFFPTDLLKKIKFRVKESEFEDKIYAFGYKVKEEECQEILEKLKKCYKS